VGIGWGKSSDVSSRKRTGTSSEVEEEKSLLEGDFLFPPPEPEGRKRAVENRKCV
jgi:hypothetical protein